MSILIRGMEIPKSCCDCFAEQRMGSDFGCGIIGFEDGNTTCFTSERRKDCPLVEVPTPHGDLIDKNALTQEYYKKASYLHLCVCLNNAPTIIESEELNG